MEWRLKGQYKGSIKQRAVWKDNQEWQALSQTSQQEGEDHVNKIRDEKGDITADTKEIQKIISEYLKIYIPINWEI
jgi:hypothetical protein